MRGPRPVPSRLKALQGNPGHRRVNPAEPQLDSQVPACPSWLTGEARAEWDRKVAELVPLGMLTAVDGAALAHYCQSIRMTARSWDSIR
jgi:phage terminase small subunit